MFSKDLSTIVQYPAGKSNKDYTVPTNITTIAPYTFDNCRYLENIILNDNITFIGKGAFYGLYIKSITLPQNITSIEAETFYACIKLESIVIPKTVTIIKNYAFYDAIKLKNATILNPACTISSSAFPTDCKIIKNNTTT